LYRILRYINCLNYITLHYITLHYITMLNSPGGSTVQCGAGRNLLCQAPLDLILSTVEWTSS